MMRAGTGMHRETTDMRFINDGLRPGVFQRLVVLPIEGVIGKYAFRHASGIVHLRANRVLFGGQWIEPVGPAKIPSRKSRYRGGKRIKKQSVNVEAMPFRWSVRTVNAVTIELAGLNALNPDVPHVAGVIASWVEIYDPASLGILGKIEELQLDAGRISAEEGEIDSSLRFKGSHG